ncbi:MAG: hypothetical protein VB050_06395 [Geobacteraceae bacterium]|nr:hypothetical protein [Geobacteraceae bacterium]
MRKKRHNYTPEEIPAKVAIDRVKSLKSHVLPGFAGVHDSSDEALHERMGSN